MYTTGLDITGAGTQSLVYWNQQEGALSVVPLPHDPRVLPWSPITQIARNMKEKNQPEEGLALADIDGDSVNEIIAGTHWYKWEGNNW